jgi:hypothetical protein
VFGSVPLHLTPTLVRLTLEVDQRVGASHFSINSGSNLSINQDTQIVMHHLMNTHRISIIFPTYFENLKIRYAKNVE